MRGRPIILHLLICFSSCYSLKYNKPNKSKDHTNTFIYYSLSVKMKVHFYFKKTCLAKTRAAGSFLPAYNTKCIFSEGSTTIYFELRR